MQTLFLLSLLLTLCLPAIHAQTPNADEILRQKKTQRKYLLAQITELQIYLGYLQKGYDIAREGLYTIRSIKNGEWDLHRIFFGSLKIVNPRIKNYAKVAAIVDNQQRVLRTFNNGWKDIKASGQFSATELDYCYQVFNRVLDDTEQNIAMLLLVLSNGELEMTDDERIACIDRLYTESQDTRLFITDFSDKVRLQAIGKARELDRTATLKTLYNLK